MQQGTWRLEARCHRSLAGLGVATLICLMPWHAAADGLDLVMNQDGSAIGELATQFTLGPLDIQAEHKEYLGNFSGSGSSTSEELLARESRFTAAGHITVQSNVELPFRFEADYQSFTSGQHDLDTTLLSGLALPGLEVSNQLALEQTFLEDAAPTQSLDGVLGFAFDWLGARHEGRLDYDLMPVTEATELAFSSNWILGNALEAAIDLRHRPLDSVSEAQLALNRSYGPFSLGSDFAADNQGGYTFGISLSLSLAPAPQTPEWRLSSLLATLGTRPRSSIQDSFGILAITEAE